MTTKGLGQGYVGHREAYIVSDERFCFPAMACLDGRQQDVSRNVSVLFLVTLGKHSSLVCFFLRSAQILSSIYLLFSSCPGASNTQCLSYLFPHLFL